MKTTRFLNMMAASLVGVAFMSCSSQDDVLTPAGQTYTMSVTAQKGGDGTRALNLDGNKLNATWTAGDEVKVYNSTSELIGTLTAQSAGATTTLTGDLTKLPTTGDELMLKYLSPSYSQQDGTLTGTANSIDKVCDYATATVTATVSGTNVTTDAAAFQNQQAVVKFTLEDKATTNTAISPTALTINDGTSDIVTLTDIPAETYSTNGAGVLFVAIPSFTGKTITLTATVGSDTYTCTTSEAKTLENGKYYGVTAKMAKQAAAPAGAEAVDLGLSVKWANMNVGAASEGDYGQFFAWGETTGYGSNTADGHNFGWASYSLCGGSEETLTKYNDDDEDDTYDGKLTLEAADDAAHVNWGGDWRMPTKAEFQELLDNTNKQWVGNYNNTGVSGYKFTSKTDASKSIFLPAAGWRNGTSLEDQGSYGRYWSSSLTEGLPSYACGLNFSSGNADMFNLDRYSGFSVRPVQGAATPAVPAGAISGQFTINSSGDKVYFSKGNLQAKIANYNSTTKVATASEWKFADSQYSYIGNAAGNTTFATGTWVDLFSWVGNSATNDTYGLITFDSSSQANHGNVSGESLKTDWGTAAASSIGEGWRTLTSAEWTYLFNTRTVNNGTGSGKSYTWGKSVNGVLGVVLYPDDYTGAEYSGSDWSDFESAGCVFLPAAGRRNGTSVYTVGTYGGYWSSTAHGTGIAYDVYFYSDSVDPAKDYERYYGFSVRLVKDAN